MRTAPKQLPTESKAHAKQLKSMKRKIFADTLKSLRVMGVRYNLDALTLEQQNSTSKVLASTPSKTSLLGCEENFLQYLDNMTLIRQDARQHSEDLSSSEVSRSLGFLEGLLLDLINQRRLLASSLDDLEAYDEVLNSLANFWNQDSAVMPRPRDAFTDATITLHGLTWLSQLLGASCMVLEKQQSIGGADTTALREELSIWDHKVCALVSSLKEQPHVPTELTTTTIVRIDQSAQSLLSELQTGLGKLKIEHPTSCFILKQLEPWIGDMKDRNYVPIAWTTAYGFKGSDLTEETLLKWQANTTTLKPSNITLIDRGISDVIDKVLLGTERNGNLLKKLPKSDDEHSWLQKADNRTAKILRSCKSDNLAEQLQQTIQGRKLKGFDMHALKVVGALCSASLPIFEEYRETYRNFINKYLELHQEEGRLACILSNTFRKMLQRGFCAASEQPKGESQAGDLENGVGLGDGEGAEDISHDIRDDEQLEDLAEQRNESDREGEIDGEPDAVDMADGALEGDTEDGEDGGDRDSGSGDADGEDDVEDELGSVSGSDAPQVDGKIWDNEDTKEGDADAEADNRGMRQSSGLRRPMDKMSGKLKSRATMIILGVMTWKLRKGWTSLVASFLSEKTRVILTFPTKWNWTIAKPLMLTIPMIA